MSEQTETPKTEEQLQYESDKAFEAYVYHLKACPFCGGSAEFRPTMFMGATNHVVRCVECGSHGEIHAFMDGAANRWNRRAA